MYYNLIKESFKEERHPPKDIYCDIQCDETWYENVKSKNGGWNVAIFVSRIENEILKENWTNKRILENWQTSIKIWAAQIMLVSKEAE